MLFFLTRINEVNGVANTCRNWVAYVHRNRFPMLVVSAADKNEFRQEGSISRLDLKRGPLAFSVEKDLSFDASWCSFATTRGWSTRCASSVPRSCTSPVPATLE